MPCSKIMQITSLGNTADSFIFFEAGTQVVLRRRRESSRKYIEREQGKGEERRGKRKGMRDK